MCSRYHFSMENDILRSYWNVALASLETGTLAQGDIFPKSTAAVLIGQGDTVTAQPLTWGYTLKDAGGIAFNARVESAAEKRMFQAGLARYRCAVPTSGFYEWNAAKEKHLCRTDAGEVLYLAGLYRRFEGQLQFTVLTCPANASMQQVHHRMPLVLPERAVKRWVFDNSSTRAMLESTPPPLVCKNLEPYQQQSLF